MGLIEIHAVSRDRARHGRDGYTVFSGTTVEKFGFEVISIEYNFYPNWHVIWVKGSGENFEKTGVAGGMSGSPMYINGRLIGAISLGYFNQREHANLMGSDTD